MKYWNKQLLPNVLLIWVNENNKGMNLTMSNLMDIFRMILKMIWVCDKYHHKVFISNSLLQIFPPTPNNYLHIKNIYLCWCKICTGKFVVLWLNKVNRYLTTLPVMKWLYHSNVWENRKKTLLRSATVETKFNYQSSELYSKMFS